MRILRGYIQKDYCTFLANGSGAVWQVLDGKGACACAAQSTVGLGSASLGLGDGGGYGAHTVLDIRRNTK